jgi:hypothetical protein
MTQRYESAPFWLAVENLQGMTDARIEFCKKRIGLATPGTDGHAYWSEQLELAQDLAIALHDILWEGV